jgi:hypothetical protein
VINTGKLWLRIISETKLLLKAIESDDLLKAPLIRIMPFFSLLHNPKCFLGFRSSLRKVIRLKSWGIRENSKEEVVIRNV